ncbi:MAG: DUF814 domain-containing protein [Spirochaetes bacterium]|nr:DUF814 domain-containing protein [Spirochaetota bacterium]
MSLNCVEIEEIIKIIPKTGIIRKYYQPDRYTLIINFLSKDSDNYLYINVADKYNRIFMIDNIENFKIQNRFSLFLNANFSGGIVKNIYQQNYSRIVFFEFQFQDSIYNFIFRLWGTGGNVILIDSDTKIIECLRRLPGRSEWPNEKFKIKNFSNDSDLSKYSIRDQFDINDLNNSIKLYYLNLIENTHFIKKKEYYIKLLSLKLQFYKNKLKILNNQIDDNNYDNYKKFGDLLLANIYKLRKGMSEVELKDFDDDKMFKIPLSAESSPNENIEKYYNKYKKIKNKKMLFDEEKKNIINIMENLENLAGLVHNIKNINKLSDIEKDIKIFENDRRVFNNNKKKPGREFILDANFIAIVSRNDKEADIILSKIAKGNDYWFHVRDCAGSHVVVKNIKGAELTQKAKLQASMLALYYSKAKKEKSSDVYFTHVKYLHKPKNGPKGLVFPTQEKNIKVDMDKQILNKLLKRKY